MAHAVAYFMAEDMEPLSVIKKKSGFRKLFQTVEPRDDTPDRRHGHIIVPKQPWLFYLPANLYSN